MIRSLLALTLSLVVLSACGMPASSPRIGPGFVNGKAVAPTVKMGDPYRVDGETYVPAYQPNYSETGMASWYGPGFHGGSTANGEKFDSGALTAAHKTLPMPSMVRVTNLSNGKSVVVRVNDRGPFAENRIIDLSKAAASRIDMLRTGVAKVRVEYLQKETEDYIAQLGGGKSPQQLAWEENHSVPQAVASNDNTWVPANTPSRDVDMSTQDAANTSAVFSADLAPLTAPAPAAQPSSSARIVSQTTVPLQAAKTSSLSAMDNQGYVHSSFDAIQGSDTATTPAAYAPASPPQAAAQAVAPEALPAGMYVQVGAFGSKANAQRIASKYASAGESHIQGIPPEAPKVYRVRIGPFTDRYSADTMLAQIRAQVPDAQLVQP